MTTGKVALLLAAALAAAYGNSLSIGLGELDDAYTVLNNPTIRSFANAPALFLDPYASSPVRQNADLRPISGLTYMLNYAISGYAPWSWHLLSLLIHLGVCLLVYELMCYLVSEDLTAPARDGAVFPCPRTSSARGFLIPLLAALTFALAPLMGGPASQYMSARSASLAALFTLGAFLAALQQRRWWAMLGWHGLALLAKPIAVTLPALLVLYAIVYRPKRLRSVWLYVYASTCLDVLYLAYRAVVLPATVREDAHAAWVTPYIWWLSELRVYLDYARRFLWPSDLSLDHQSGFVTTLADPRAFLPLLCLLVWTLGAWTLRREYPLVAFCAGWWVLCLLPESSVIALSETQTDHRAYLPATLGMAPLVACALVWGLRERAVGWGCLILALAAVAVTHERNWVMSDSVRLWEYEAHLNPQNCRAQMNAGVPLMRRGQYAQARRYFDETRRLCPFYSFAWANLAILDNAEGKLEASAMNKAEARRLGYPWGLP